MKLISMVLFIVMINVSGCTTTPTQLERNPQAAQTCGQTVNVAIESSSRVENTEEECSEMKTTARKESGENNLLLNVAAYVAGYLIASLIL